MGNGLMARVLAISIAILETIFGLFVIIGASKKYKMKGVYFCIICAIFAMLTISGTFFYTGNEAPDYEILRLNLPSYILITSVITLFAAAQSTKAARIVSIIDFIVSIGLSVLVYFDIYNSIISEFYFNGEIWTYEIIFSPVSAAWFFSLVINMIVMIVITLKDQKRIENPIIKKGTLIMSIGYGITMLLEIAVNAILIESILLVWIEPLLVWAFVASVFLAIVRYGAIELSSIWQKRLSTLLVIATFVAAYIIALSTLTQLVVKNNYGDISIVFTNVVISIVFILSIPLVNATVKKTASEIIKNSKDMKFVGKEILKYAEKNRSVGLNKFLAYVANVMEVSYVGLVINKKLYGSIPLSIDQRSIDRIMGLGKAEKGFWQKVSKELSDDLADIGITRVAAITSDGNLVVAQLLVGDNVSNDQTEDIQQKFSEVMPDVSASVVNYI